MRVPSVLRVCRGGRELSADIELWRCPGDCEDPDGDGVYEFTDAALARENEQRLDRAWSARFGEPLPPRRGRGRPSVERRDERLQLRMSGPELRLLDAARGATSRSEFVREALKPMVPAIQEGTPSSAGGPLVSLRQLERRLRRIETSARRRTAPIREVA